MTESFVPSSGPAPEVAPPAATPASPVVRALAGLVGLALLLATLVFTFGIALLALAGVLIAWRLARRRGRPFTRGACGAGAILGGVLGMALVLGTGALFVPAGTLDRMQREMATASQAEAQRPPAPPPEWLGRVAPGSTSPEAQRAQQEQTLKMMRSPGFMTTVVIVGGLFTCLFVGGAAGLGSWGASLLLAYALRGRPLARRVVSPPAPPPLFGAPR